MVNFNQFSRFTKKCNFNKLFFSCRSAKMKNALQNPIL